MTDGMVALLIPIVAILMVLGVVVAGIWGQAQARRIKAEQRMAMLARGLPIAEIERLLGAGEGEASATRDPLRSLGRVRRTALILTSFGIGVIGFGLVVVAISDREKLWVPGAGLVPLAIGLGFLVDYAMQRRELARFGVEVGAGQP